MVVLLVPGLLPVVCDGLSLALLELEEGEMLWPVLEPPGGISEVLESVPSSLDVPSGTLLL